MNLFKLVGSIFIDNESANDSIAKTDKKASSLGNTLASGCKKAAAWGTAIVGGAGTAVAGLTKLATGAAETADVIDKGSQKMGISTTAYQEWDYAMGQCGMSIDTMQNGMKTMSNLMDGAAQGTASAQSTFDRLGVSIYDSSGKMKSQEQMMSESIMALSNMAEGADRTALAVDLFGKSGTELAPLLNEGADGVQTLIDRSHELGLVMSEDNVKAGVTLGDTIDDIKQAFGALVTRIGSKVVPIIQKVCDSVLKYMPQIEEMFNQVIPVIFDALEQILPPLMDLASQIMPVILDLVSTLVPVIMQIAAEILPIIVQLITTLLPPILQIVQMVLPLLVTILNAVTPILTTVINLLTPILDLAIQILQPVLDLIMQAVTPLINVIMVLINSVLTPLIPIISALASVITGVLGAAFKIIIPVVSPFIGILTTVISVVSTVANAMLTVFGALVEPITSIFNQIKSAVSTPINAIIGFLNGFIGGITDGINVLIDALNTLHIDVPGWVEDLTGISGFGFDIPNLTAPEIPMLEGGGELKAGQAFIANEKGPEVVGNVGNKTVVINNQQILQTTVEGVKAGVYSAMTDISDKIIDAIKANAGGDIVIPVYIGSEQIDNILINSKQRVSYRSGGRANV